MKNRRVLTVLALMFVGMTAFAAGSKENTTQDGSFSPVKKIDFYISSAPGGSSDMFTRTIADISATEKFVMQPFVIYNMPDGVGNVARLQVNTTKDPNTTLLCFSSGDLSAMVTNCDLRMSDFVPVAILAADKHLIFSGKNGKYKTMQELMTAVKNGAKVTIGGTKSDERTAYDMFVKEVAYPDNFSYVTYEASTESITAVLGGHIDLAMGKPASGKAYVESGDIVPVVALASERFFAPFDNAPTMVEAGYKTVEFPVWRGVIASKNMSPAALNFWSETMQKVVKTEKWQKNYLEKFMLAPNFKNAEEAQPIMEDTEKNVLATMKK